jgi:branched-chain amino acid transport system ATP-binding protein
MVTPVLDVQDLSVTFGGLKAVDSVSFDVEPGELLGVIGPNGAGKTTLLNAIMGVVPTSHGTVNLNGANVTGNRPDVIAAKGIGRTFQHADFFSEFSVLDALLLGRWAMAERSVVRAIFRLPTLRASERTDEQAALALLERLGLLHVTEAVQSELSYGTRKVLDVARALLMEPTVLLLDEPTSGTTSEDRARLREVVATIKEEGISTVLVDHDVSFTTDVSDSAMAMNFGRKLGEALPSELLARPDVRAAYVGLE